ncbi:MAG: putative sensor domain DACNV-containing protein, partial [Phycisphaerae bacterium]
MTTIPESEHTPYIYPDQFARIVLDAWKTRAGLQPYEKSVPAADTPLHEDSLREVLSTCFQSSLLREEERAITFRLFLGKPDVLPQDGGPPLGVQ